MALETGTYISSLNASNPVTGDPKTEGDDHFRLLKATILATFAGLTGTPLRLSNTATRQYLYAAGDLYAIGLPYNTARAGSGQCYFVGSTDAADPDLVFSSSGGDERLRLTNTGILKNTGNTQPSFSAYRSTNQTSGTQVVFDTEYFDYGGVYANGTGVFTAPVTGIYLITVSIAYASAAGAIPPLFTIKVNGSVNIGALSDTGRAGTRTMSMTLIQPITATHTVTVVSGFTLDGNDFVTTTGGASYFGARLLG